MSDADEIAAFLLARDERGARGEILDAGHIEWARGYIAKHKDEAHEGDCPHIANPAPFTCSRCVCDDAIEDAKKIAAFLAGHQQGQTK